MGGVELLKLRNYNLDNDKLFIFTHLKITILLSCLCLYS